MAPDRAERLVDLTLPSRWADELAAGLTSAWAKAARRHASPPTIRRVAAELEPRIRARFGDPERPRKRLRGPARSLARAKAADKLARAELTIEAEGLLAPLITGAEREAERATDRLLAEEALGKDAQKLHRLAVRAKHDGVGGMDEVIEDEACALATALLIYWLARPHWYRQWVRRAEVPSSGDDRATWDLLRRIEAKLAARPEDDGFFHLGVVLDPRTWEKGHDWTRDVYGKYPRRAELPPHVWIRTTPVGIEPIPPPKRRKR